MARRLILDTGVVIHAERTGRPRLGFDAEDDVAIAAITAAELWMGVELADEARRRSRARSISDLLASTPVESYDLDVAAAHARLLARVRRSGRPRSAHDLIIAATAVATGRTLVTTDRRARYGDLPELECVEV